MCQNSPLIENTKKEKKWKETGKILPVWSELYCFPNVNLKGGGGGGGRGGAEERKKNSTVWQNPNLVTQVENVTIGAT